MDEFFRGSASHENSTVHLHPAISLLRTMTITSHIASLIVKEIFQDTRIQITLLIYRMKSSAMSIINMDSILSTNKYLTSQFKEGHLSLLQ